MRGDNSVMTPNLKKQNNISINYFMPFNAYLFIYFPFYEYT